MEKNERIRSAVYKTRHSSTPTMSRREDEIPKAATVYMMSPEEEEAKDQALVVIHKGDITKLWVMSESERVRFDHELWCIEAILAGNPNDVLKFLITALKCPFSKTTRVLATSYHMTGITCTCCGLNPMSIADCIKLVLRRRFDMLRFLRKNDLNEVCSWPTASDWRMHFFIDSTTQREYDGNKGPKNSMKLLACLMQPQWVADVWNEGKANMKEASDKIEKADPDFKGPSDYMCQLANVIENVQKTPSIALWLRPYVNGELNVRLDDGVDKDEEGAVLDLWRSAVAVVCVEAFNEADVKLFFDLLPRYLPRPEWKPMTLEFNNAVVVATAEEARKPETLRSQCALPNFKEPEHLRKFAAEAEHKVDNNWFLVFKRGDPWSK
jgi:hypothetical protein